MQDVVKTDKAKAVTLNRPSRFVRLDILIEPFIIFLSEVIQKSFRLRISVGFEQPFLGSFSVYCENGAEKFKVARKNT